MLESCPIVGTGVFHHSVMLVAWKISVTADPSASARYRVGKVNVNGSTDMKTVNPCIIGTFIKII